MSDLYRSAIGARISKLPHLPSLADSEDDEQERGETEDCVGMLPGSGMGPPALQVLLLIFNFTDAHTL
jgi:protein phosphatase methylesterase 1